MMVNFYGNKRPSIYVSRERGERIKHLLNTEIKFIDIDDEMFAVGNIESVTEGGDTVNMFDKSRALPSSTMELSEEKRESNIKKLREMKQKYLNRDRSKYGKVNENFREMQQ